jgi:hypothetical protein
MNGRYRVSVKYLMGGFQDDSTDMHDVKLSGSPGTGIHKI